MNSQSRKLMALLIALSMLLNIGVVAYADGNIGSEKNGTVSMFSILSIETGPTTSFNFYVDEVLVDTQIVLNGENLKEPSAPVKANKRFLGWETEGEGTFIDFSQPIIVGETSNTIKVNAVYEDRVYVYFVYKDNIIKTKEVDQHGKTNSDDVPLVIHEDGKALSHWSISKGGAEFDFDTQITEDTTLYAVLSDMWKVSFDSQGGSSLLPKYIPDGSALGNVDIPVRIGYEFKGWNTEADGTGTDYDDSTTINSVIKLYAKWDSKTDTPYTVLYWQENANDDEYTLKEVASRTGTTGEETSYENKTYTGFNLNTTKTNEINVAIKGDGSSVKNVYYDRNTWTLDFQIEIETGNTGWPWYNPTYTWTSVSTTTIKQGADTSQWWNPAVGTYPTYAWYTTKTGNIAYSLAPDMPDGNLTVYGRNSGDTKYTIFYLENGTTIEINPQYNFNGSNGLTLTIEDYIAFPGFTVKSTPTDGSENSKYNDNTKRYEWEIKYTRNKYNITFQKNNQTGSQTILGIPYQEDISNKALDNYTVDFTIRASDGFVFKGWYDNESTEGDPYNFTGKTMPVGNLILYAKWAPPVYSLKYHETQNNEDPLKTVDEIAHSNPISEENLTKEIPHGLSESDFEGWYWYLDGVFVPYDFNTPVINNDYVLYPVWKNSIYKVTYDPGLGSGTVPVDNNNYLLNSAANVLSPTDLVSPSGKVFIGWKNLNNPESKIYYPNYKLAINGNMTLTAQWGDIVADTTLTYKANGGIGADVSVNLKNNTRHEVKQNMFTREGYKFTGWEDQSADVIYQIGDEIVVGNGDPVPNELYAQWEVKDDIEYTVNYLEQGTEKVLAPAKTENGAFGEEIIENAIEISGYEKLAPTKVTITLGVNQNIITFLYKEIIIPSDPGPSDPGPSDPGPSDPGPTNPEPNLPGPSYPDNEDEEEYEIVIVDEEIPAAVPELNKEDHIQYIQGYSDNTLRPEAYISREEVAAVFYRLLTDEYRNSIKTTAHNFSDISVGRWSRRHIATLANGGIIKGYEDGSFRPSEYIKRAEVATIASRFDNLSPFEADRFSDISGHWANEFINSASKKGWIHGNPDGTFKPDEFITRAEFVTLVNNVLDRKVKKEDILLDAKQFPDLLESKWYYEAMQEAINSHHYIRKDDGFEEWTEIYYPEPEL